MEKAADVAEVGGFDFLPEYDGSLSLESAVFQALGAASVCWEQMSGTGVFHSDRAKQIGDALLAFIEEEFDNREADLA